MGVVNRTCSGDHLEMMEIYFKSYLSLQQKFVPMKVAHYTVKSK